MDELTIQREAYLIYADHRIFNEEIWFLAEAELRLWHFNASIYIGPPGGHLDLKSPEYIQFLVLNPYFQDIQIHAYFKSHEAALFGWNRDIIRWKIAEPRFFLLDRMCQARNSIFTGSYP